MDRKYYIGDVFKYYGDMPIYHDQLVKLIYIIPDNELRCNIYRFVDDDINSQYIKSRKSTRDLENLRLYEGVYMRDNCLKYQYHDDVCDIIGF